MRWLLIVLLGASLGCQGEHTEAHEDHREHAEEEHSDEKRGDEHGDEHSEGEEEHTEGEVTLSVAAIKRVGLRTAQVTTGALKGVVEAPAEVQLNPDQVVHITPIVEGKLLSVAVSQGDLVRADQPLAAIRSVALGKARAALAHAAALRTVARKTLRRQKKLRKAGISSERALQSAQSAMQQAEAEHAAARAQMQVFGLNGGAGPDMDLRSPMAGRVLDRHATRGENVTPNDTLFVVADLSQVWVMGRVYEQQISQVKLGMKVGLTLVAYPGRTWTGTVDFMATALDEATRTLPIRMVLPNPEGLLHPGLFGTMRLSAPAAEDAVVLVPLTAVQTMDGRSVVFVPGHEPGEFEQRAVSLGRESHDQVEVLKGLTPKSQVVISGAFVLKSELMRDELGHDDH